jgi:hypothetical protein
MHHTFKISAGIQSRTISVEGNREYALFYIAGYIQAMRDKMNLDEFAKIDVLELHGTTIEMPIASLQKKVVSSKLSDNWNKFEDKIEEDVKSMEEDDDV